VGYKKMPGCGQSWHPSDCSLPPLAPVYSKLNELKLDAGLLVKQPANRIRGRTT